MLLLPLLQHPALHFNAAAPGPTTLSARAHTKVGRMVLADRSGVRMPAVRATIADKIGAVYKGLDTTLECFPADDVADDPDAYKAALKTMRPGDAAIIFTPDDTHHFLAEACIEV